MNREIDALAEKVREPLMNPPTWGFDGMFASGRAALNVLAERAKAAEREQDELVRGAAETQNDLILRAEAAERERDHYRFHFDQQEQRAEAAEADAARLCRALSWIVVESGNKQSSWWSPEYPSQTFDSERREAIHEVAKHALATKEPADA